jgi:hypothetical protein
VGWNIIDMPQSLVFEWLGPARNLGPLAFSGWSFRFDGQSDTPCRKSFLALSGVVIFPKDVFSLTPVTNQHQ